MKPFQKILVPVDFSTHSADAVRYAADLSRRYEASLVLVHVYQSVAFAFPEGYVLYTPLQLADMMAECEAELDAAKAVAVAAGARDPSTAMLQGAVASEIVAFAAKHHHDLIVMGTRGRTGITHALLGSVAEKVVRLALCPVLTVRTAEHS